MIENIKELQKLFIKINFEESFHELPEYILVNLSDVNDRRMKLLQATEHLRSDQLCVIAIIANKNDKIETALLVIRPHELHALFLKYIEEHLTTGSSVGVLTFLKKSWEQDPQAFPLTFLLSTQEKNTLIADRAVGVAYQNKGIMKQISLAMVEHLLIRFGENHKLISFTIHPATYLFFNPKDKELLRYDSEGVEEKTCKEILAAHNYNVKIQKKDSAATQGLLKNSILATTSVSNETKAIESPYNSFSNP